MPWIGFINGMSHYYLGGGVVQNYYRAYLGDIKWSISLILCNKIYARVAQYYILRPFKRVYSHLFYQFAVSYQIILFDFKQEAITLLTVDML